MQNKKLFDLTKLKKDQAKITKDGAAAAWYLRAAMMGWVIFTGTLIFDIVDHSKPEGSDWLPWVATIFISGGFLIWLAAFEKVGLNDDQRKVASTMLVVSWIAELLMAAADMIINTTLFNIVLPAGIQWLVITMPVLVVLIYSAGAARFWYLDPSAQLRLGINEAMGTIYAARNTALADLAEAEADRLGATMAEASLGIEFTKATGHQFDTDTAPFTSIKVVKPPANGHKADTVILKNQ